MIWASVKRLFFIGISSSILQRKFYLRIPLTMGRITLSPADAQAKLIPTGGSDVLLTMPVLQDKAWFVHAHMGRVRACTADGASVTGDRPGPRCSNWTE
jgi:hypothetical protein